MTTEIDSPTGSDTEPTRKPKVDYTGKQQEIIDGLVEAQKHLELSDAQFAKNYLKTITESVWNKLKHAAYDAKDQTKAFTELEAALISTRRRIARQLKNSTSGPYFELPLFKAMFLAVKDCLLKRGENRLIVHVAPTGGGKSRFIAELDTKETVTTVRANESWRTSYYFASLDIIKALVPSGTETKISTGGVARSLMLDTMRNRAEVLAIDEGNYFGPRSINLVKDLLNETEWTVLISMTPEHWMNMKRHWATFSQLQRRLHQVFVHQELTAAQCQEILTSAGLNGDAKTASVALVNAANSFGSFDFVSRVIERMDEVVTAKHPTLADVEAAIAVCKAKMALV